jgi:hypothetical protein
MLGTVKCIMSGYVVVDLVYEHKVLGCLDVDRFQRPEHEITACLEKRAIEYQGVQCKIKRSSVITRDTMRPYDHYILVIDV